MMKRTTEIYLTDGLKSALSKYGCEIIRGNQVAANLPYFPYVSYISTTPISANAKTWCKGEEGVYYRQLSQVLSLTVHSDEQEQADDILLVLFKWFDFAGSTYLSDRGIYVERVLTVGNRDNLISVDYEYMRGLDVSFSTIETIEESEISPQETIEHFEFNDRSEHL